MTENTKALSGNFAMLTYVLITALSSIFIHNVNQHIPPLLTAFYTFLFCLCTYSTGAGKLLRKKEIILNYWFEVLLLNITTAICWIFTFLSLKILSAEYFLFVYLCSMPITLSIIYRKNIILILLFIVGLVALAYTYTNIDHSTLGFLLAFLGGFAGTIYSIYSKKISIDFTSFEILSLRFYLIVLITFLINAYDHSLEFVSVQLGLKFLLLSAVTVILPLYFYQVGIKNLQVKNVLSYLPFAPLLCYAINFFYNNKPFDLVQILIVLFLFVLMIITFKQRGEKNAGDGYRSGWRHRFGSFKLFVK